MAHKHDVCLSLNYENIKRPPFWKFWEDSVGDLVPKFYCRECGKVLEMEFAVFKDKEDE